MIKTNKFCRFSNSSTWLVMTTSLFDSNFIRARKCRRTLTDIYHFLTDSDKDEIDLKIDSILNVDSNESISDKIYFLLFFSLHGVCRQFQAPFRCFSFNLRPYTPFTTCALRSSLYFVNIIGVKLPSVFSPSDKIASNST